MLSKIFLVALFVFVMLIMSFRGKGKKKIVFFGDSITQQGILAGGYIKRIDSLMMLDGSNEKYETHGAGVSGNKVYDLYLRMDEDVLSKSPAIVVVYIGVNDVWHKTKRGTGTDEDKFEQFYRAIIRKLQAGGSKVILCTPAVIGEKKDFANQQDGDLNIYSNIIRKLSTEFNLGLVDLRKEFLAYNQTHNPNNLDKNILTVDGVHLNPIGNELVAEKMYVYIKQAMGL
jgi:lysophospholipase L1-like esterase